MSRRPEDILSAKIGGLNLVLLMSLLALSVVFLSRIDRPWVGKHHANHGAMYHNFARSYLRYGYIETAFGQVYDVGMPAPEKFDYWTHRLPFVSLMLSLWIILLGSKEWVVRLPSVLASILLVLMIFRFVRNRYGEPEAALTALFVSLAPLILVFGDMPGCEIISLTLSIWSIHLYLDWAENPESTGFWKVWIAYFAACLAAWFSFFAIAPCLLHFFLNRGLLKSRTWQHVALVGIPLIVTGIFFIHLQFLGDTVGGVFQYMTNKRMGLAEEHSVTFLEFARLVTARIAKGSAFIPLVFSLAWIATYIFRWRKHEAKDRDRYPFYYLLYGGLCVVSLRQASTQHHYYPIYLIPFLGLAAALSVVDFLRSTRRSFLQKTALLVFVLLAFIASAGYRLSQAGKYLGEEIEITSANVGKRLSPLLPPGSRVIVLKSTDRTSPRRTRIEFYLDRKVDIANGQEQVDELLEGGTIAAVIDATDNNKFSNVMASLQQRGWSVGDWRNMSYALSPDVAAGTPASEGETAASTD